MNEVSKPAVDMVNIEIDGVATEAPKGSMIIEAADRLGIDIPRFCYHRKLSIAANCRMCLVDVEKAPKPLPACATPVMDGMKVYTESRRASDAQKGVMEFLLINHPLDCPICDQGGECELQDLAMGYGRSVSRFTERKRVVKDKNVGPLIQTDMTRCIHCTRCVRFLEEIAGTSEMGGTGRGDRTEIGTCIERSIDSELSGNVIDLCPVGALTNKPFRFSARAWELTAKAGLATHDGLGSNLYYHTRRGQILRAVPRDNEAINESWLADRDRYSHFGLYSEDRATQPLLKRNGEWLEVDWDEALAAAGQTLLDIQSKHGPEQLGFLLSPSTANENYYLAGRLAAALGCANVDHRLRQQDFSGAGLPPVFETSIEALANQQSILLVGCNVRHEAPILGHKVRQANLAGANISALNVLHYNFNFELDQERVVAPQHLLAELAGIAAALRERTGVEPETAIRDLIAEASVDETHRGLADQLSSAEQATVLLGHGVYAHPAAGALFAVARYITEAAGAALNLLPIGGNTTGAWKYAALPTADGLDAQAMLNEARAGYLLWDFEPGFDTANPSQTMRVLHDAEKVIAVSSYASNELKEVADIILPLAANSEAEGSWTNLEGVTQACQAVSRAPGQAKAGWKILRQLAQACELSGFDYVSLTDVQAGQANVQPVEVTRELNINAMADGWQRIGELPMFAVDAQCRRAEPLQQSPHSDYGFAVVNPLDAEQLAIQDGDELLVKQAGGEIRIKAKVSSMVPAQAVYLRSGVCLSHELGEAFGPLRVEKV